MQCDCYTTLTTESYIAVTCHYIEEEWRVKSVFLLTESMSVGNTADNLAEKLNQAVHAWELGGCVCLLGMKCLPVSWLTMVKFLT